MRVNLERYIVKNLPDGKPLFLFDHPIMQDDSSEGSPYAVELGKRGIDYDSAVKKAAARTDNEKEQSHYRVSVPCVACCDCVIIQDVEKGQYVNSAYYCRLHRMPCERYGTCDHGREGKLGPHVIKRDLTMEEILAHKDELVN